MGPMYRATVSVTQFMIPDEILWRIAVYWPDLGNHWHEAIFFLLYAAWVRSRAERRSVSYTKVIMEVARTGHNLQFTKTN